jgi:hypothetical protein
MRQTLTNEDLTDVQSANQQLPANSFAEYAPEPMIFAQMGMLQALHRHHKREFNPDRNDHHWGKRKLKRDQ